MGVSRDKAKEILLINGVPTVDGFKQERFFKEDVLKIINSRNSKRTGRN